METVTPHQWLCIELAEKKALNPRYSLRMMAKRVGISPGRFSEFLSGKRSITPKQAQKIADGLNLDFGKRSAFLRLVNADSTSSKLRLKNMEDVKFRQLSEDAFNAVADWYHFAILSLMDVDDFKMQPEWIGNRLGLAQSTVGAALQRLKNLGLIEKRGRTWRKIDASHTTTHDVPSAALRISHKQSLRQAMDALDEVAVDLRDITSITMAVDLKSIPAVKKMIRAFRKQVSSVMETGRRTEVYNLNVQLVPVSKTEKVKMKYEN